MPRGKNGIIALQALVIVGMGAAVGLADLGVRGVAATLEKNTGNLADDLLKGDGSEEPTGDTTKVDPPAEAEEEEAQGSSEGPQPGERVAQGPTETAADSLDLETLMQVDPPADWPEMHITIGRASKLFVTGRVVFVDARIDADYVAGHVPGAHHLPVSAFEGGYPDRVMYVMDPNAVTIVYCSGGDDCEAAEDVAVELQNAGFTELYIMHDGWPGWVAAGLPVETGEDPYGF